MSTFYPHTTTLVTHSFAERLLTAEFDDALVDQAAWKNSRYDGARLIQKIINTHTDPIPVGIGTARIGTSFRVGKYFTWEGDQSYQDLPVITNQSTALYIANSCVGGLENPQYASIKNHSYVSVNKILIIDPDEQTVQILDKTVEPYDEFHRFITNDFPTGNKAYLKIIDQSTPTALKGHHRVKMNKGFLLKTFSFNYANEPSGSDERVLQENNSMYLYRKGNFQDNYVDGTLLGSASELPGIEQGNQLRFRYSVMEMFPSTAAGQGQKFSIRHVGPSFASSSIHQNQYTQQYYTGSYGILKHADISGSNVTSTAMLNATAMASASRFIALDTLKHLRDNVEDTTLTNQEKTEVHLTFFQGTKDFAPGFHDERSISTFEVDQNQAILGVEQGGECNASLPTNHELIFKGPNDNRFMPTTSTFLDNIQSAHLVASSSGCVPPETNVRAGGFGAAEEFIQSGLTLDKIEDADTYVQGGILGPIGYEGAQTSSAGSYGNSQLDNMDSQNFYSGSFNYEISFLKKDHTLILDLNKETELEFGIGNQGLVIIPQNSLPAVWTNIDYYLQLAGITNITNPPASNPTPPPGTNPLPPNTTFTN